MSILESEWDPFNAPKKKANIRARGQNFERRMCKLLTEWSDLKYSRVPNSGGIKSKDKADYKGDIYADGSPFVIECKSVTGGKIVIPTKEPGIARLDYNMKSAMLQALGDAYSVGSIPIVLRNHERKVIMAIPVVKDLCSLHYSGEYTEALGPEVEYYDGHKCMQHTSHYIVIKDFLSYTKQVTYEKFWEDIKSMFPYLTSVPDTSQP